MSATRTTLANSKALERAAKLLAYANLKRAELAEFQVWVRVLVRLLR